jgi:phospholipase/carboxylesterase
MTTKTLNYLSKEPAKQLQNIIIFIHGYGSSGNDLISLASYFNLPNTGFISPHAPKIMAPNSYYWFPIDNFEAQHLLNGINSALETLDNFIKEISQKYQVKNKSQIILCGFSQGALLALHYALTQKEPLGAVLAFSGGAVNEYLKDNIKNQTPICLVHGENDQVLPATYSKETALMLKNKKHPHSLKIIKKLEHNINKTGLDFAKSFLEELNI